jgi:hypothetical protein
MYLDWDTEPTYTPALRSLAGDLETLGSAGYSVCCGGAFGVDFIDQTCEGTGHYSSVSYTWPTDVDGSIEIDETPGGSALMDGTALIDGTTYTFTATPACSYATSAELDIADTIWEYAGVYHDCSEGDYGTVSRSDGTLSVDVTVHVKDTSACKACCGRAKMVANANDGCGTNADTKTYYVVTAYTGANPWIGWKLYCVWDGSNWREMKENLYCDGTLAGGS